MMPSVTLFRASSQAMHMAAMTVATATLLLLLLLAAPAAVFSVNHTVGGSSGWTQGVDYDTWAAGETFTVGDNLLFSYGSSHSVDEVSKTSYDSCSTSSPIASHSGGSTTVALTAAGTRYFLCPTPGHCSSQGMKVAVTVVASSTPSPPSGSSSSSPSPPPPPGTASPSNGVAGKFVGMSHLVVGLVPMVALVV